jgi:transposase
MIGALTLAGLVAMMTIEGATDGDVFEAFVEKVLLPVLRPGDIVVLDNVGAHRTQRVRDLIQSVGARLVFLPPYSPDLNPIEECWSKVKQFIRSIKPRSRDALDFVVGAAMKEVSPSDAAGWFGHAGYAVRSN